MSLITVAEVPNWCSKDPSLTAAQVPFLMASATARPSSSQRMWDTAHWSPLGRAALASANVVGTVAVGGGGSIWEDVAVTVTVVDEILCTDALTAPGGRLWHIWIGFGCL